MPHAKQTQHSKPAGYHRRRAYAAWIGAMVFVFTLYLLAPMALPWIGLKAPALGAPLPFIMIALTIFGYGWLALYVFGEPHKRDKGRPAKKRKRRVENSRR